MIYAFEDIGSDLPLLPLAARRALDIAGLRLSLKAWQKLPLTARRVLVEQGSGAVDEGVVREAVTGADPPATPLTPDDEARLAEPPAAIAFRVDWARLSQLERFALAHLVARGRHERLEQALREIAGSPLTHLDERGDARMVDVGEKVVTHRRAVARAVVAMLPSTAQLIEAASPKGDVIAAARIAGIQAAKRTSELIPLCHAIALTRVALSFAIDAAAGRVTIEAVAEARDRTGVEMEAMVAASVAALTIYDMLKAVERGIRISEVVLIDKSGGRSGHYQRKEPEGT